MANGNKKKKTKKHCLKKNAISNGKKWKSQRAMLWMDSLCFAIAKKRLWMSAGRGKYT